MKNKWADTELTIEVIVGAFLVMIFLGLAYFTIILSKERMFGPKHRITVLFKDVMGLREGDNVAVRGMTIGKVKDMELADNGVKVLVSLNKQLHIKKGYKMSVLPSSVLGGCYMQIDEGPQGPNLDDLPPDMLFVGEPPRDLMGDAAEVVSALKKSMIDGGVLKNIESVSDEAGKIAARLAEGKGTIGRLLSEDDKLYTDMSDAVASAKRIAERLEKGEGALGKLMASDTNVFEDLSAAVKSLRDVADRIAKGEGSVGKLIQDDALYEDLKATVNEIRATIDDYRETAPLVTFSSVFFGAF